MRLCHLFALSLGAVGLLAVAPAQACWWGHGGGYGGGWGMGYGGYGYGGARYAAPAYAPGPGYYAPGPVQYAPPPGYAAPRTYYTPPPAMAPGTVMPGPARVMPGTGTPTVAASQATVSAQDDMFNPPTLNVQPGTTVRWNNTGKHPHTVTDRDGRFDSGDIAPGGAYTVTFHSPGTYRYYCKHHKGMEGTIVVGEPGKGPAGGAGTSKGPAY
jgi:plastocyanin